MRAFSALLERLQLTPARSGKVKLLADYFQSQGDPDRGLALAVFVGRLDLPSFASARVRALALERVDAKLFELSYDYVGDVLETVALIWPAPDRADPSSPREPKLSEVIGALQGAPKARALDQIADWLDAMDAAGRWALLKFLAGRSRFPVDPPLVKHALVDYSGKTLSDIEEIWGALEAPYGDLFAWLDGRGPRPPQTKGAWFRPVMQAQPLPENGPEFLDPKDFAAEWKWDGVRVQAVARAGDRKIYSCAGEDLSGAFPDVCASLNFEGAVDGELLVRASERTLGGFDDLHQRLTRTSPDKALIERLPAFVRAFDLLDANGQDLRARSFRDRRGLLATLLRERPSPRLDLSPLIEAHAWGALARARANPPGPGVEGLMLKRWDSPYVEGRPKGLWWAWKRDPYVIDAVLLYARLGRGARSALYCDFTFGCWKDGILESVGNAALAAAHDEDRLDRFVRANTTERFGPVRAVRANADFGLVLEIAFDALVRAPRRKSGLALRGARIRAIGWDKPVAQADLMARLEDLLPAPRP